MEPKKQINIDSPEADPIWRTDIKGWAGQDGYYYGKDEVGKQRARLAACTHIKCSADSCTNWIPKERAFGLCDFHSEKRSHQRYLDHEFTPYQPDMVVCERNGDQYFFGPDEIEDYLMDQIGDNPDHDRFIHLFVCEKTKFSPIRLDYIAEEVTHEAWEPDPELIKKLEEFNTFLIGHSTESWQRTKIRTTFYLEEL